MQNSDLDLCNEITKDFYNMGFGNTPMFVHSINNGSRVFAKLEYFNPFGSIKDRGSFFMVEDLLKRNEDASSIVVVDGSSGNTGIAVGNICRKLGIKSIIFVPPGTAVETRRELEKSGAKIEIVGDGPETTSTEMAIEKAKTLSIEKPDEYKFLHQHGNQMNFKAHIHTTGPEGLKQMENPPDYVAISMGTGGSIIGNGIFFKGINNHTKIVMMQSNQDAYIQGVRNFMKAKDKIIIEKNISIVDRMLNLSEKDAEEGVRYLKNNYGLLVGFSAGANFSGAVKVAEEHPGSTVYTVFPDSGAKYRSLYLKRNLMNETEFDTLSRDILTMKSEFLRL